ncbi:hypothetical protein FKX85_14500 [Echinicola soli]|uniref:Lipoprotein n=1 Tax=Echinicola soli TaxID=2591634 RepID=A0A514CKJ3_9BACT|nr:hypothetical protein [Echinicola soli]QDH80184.1 hypothetical protein FKX85_14500 [Echinicola soli]
MKRQEMARQKGISVISVLLVIVAAMGCASAPLTTEIGEDHKMAYEVINLLPLSERGLYYKTLDRDDPSIYGMLDYATINQNNRKESFVLELERYMDLDTVFTERQRIELDRKLKSVESVELDKRRLNVKQLRYDHKETGKLEKITFPVFQKDAKGSLYAILYYSWATPQWFNGASKIYIYKRKNGKWEKFAMVFVSIT